MAEFLHNDWVLDADHLEHLRLSMLSLATTLNVDCQQMQVTNCLPPELITKDVVILCCLYDIQQTRD